MTLPKVFLFFSPAFFYIIYYYIILYIYYIKIKKRAREKNKKSLQ
jgi:hypothetical protein